MSPAPHQGTRICNPPHHATPPRKIGRIGPIGPITSAKPTPSAILRSFALIAFTLLLLTSCATNSAGQTYLRWRLLKGD